ILKDAANLLKTNVEGVPQRIEDIQKEMRSLAKENESLTAKLSNIEASKMLEQIETVEGVNVLTQRVNIKDMHQLRLMVDDLKENISSGVILLATATDGKVLLASGVTNDLTKRGIHAGHLIDRSEEHTSELQSRFDLVCRLL